MNRPTMLLEQVLVNFGLLLSLAVNRDSRVIESRYQREGMSFLTITLPVLCDALDQGLAKGRIMRRDFPGFKPRSRRSNLPALLAGFYMRIFDDDGCLLAVPCIDSIRAIRQVTRLFKKVELPCSPARTSRAFERFVTNEQELSGIKPDSSQLWCSLRHVAGYLWSDLEELSGRIYCSPGIFGSGATAEKLGYNQRHAVKQWPERGEHLYPLSVHSSHREDDLETFNGIEALRPEDEHPVRVVTVPKTLKTPRIIAVEPSYMMLRQQSLARPLMAYLENDHSYRGSIRFTDQTVNRDNAMIGSLRGENATIDLSDASDRVSLTLVEEIFGRVAPSFLDLSLGSRSTKAKLPERPILTLNKFASMGSAMCFPMESMVFFTIVAAAIYRRSGKRLSRKLLASITASIDIYGDDIIVPVETAAGVMEDLEAFGLKVNHDKSFTSGLFRESCGGDYYQGHCVTPAYCRQWTSSNRLDVKTLSAYVSLSNQFYMKGLWHASQYIRNSIERSRLLIGGLRDNKEEKAEGPKNRRAPTSSVTHRSRQLAGSIPRSRYPIGVLHYVSCLFTTGLRYEGGLHGYRVRGIEIVAGRVQDEASTFAASMLLKFGASPTRQSVDWAEPRKISGYRDDADAFYRKSLVLRDYGSAGQRGCNGLADVLDDKTRMGRKASFSDDLLNWRSLVDEAFASPHGTPSVIGPVADSATDFLTSVRPYSLKTKSRWIPVIDGVGNWA